MYWALILSCTLITDLILPYSLSQTSHHTLGGRPDELSISVNMMLIFSTEKDLRTEQTPYPEDQIIQLMLQG